MIQCWPLPIAEGNPHVTNQIRWTIYLSTFEELNIEY